MLEFKYKKDRQYFADKLSDGSVAMLEKRHDRLFDFRNPKLKRAEYNAKKQSLFSVVFRRAQGICQICKAVKGIEIDHKIPLASNYWNKKFRGMRPKKVNGRLKKVSSESYGSNHLENLQLACKSCNRKKWHRF